MLRDHVYLSNSISERDEILQGDTKLIELYFNKFSDQMEYKNILFQSVEGTRQILSNLPN
jgi:hypothetical protein